MERRTNVEPGYDCRKVCQHERKGDHGIRCDEWWFVVVDGDHAVTLTVFSGKFPASVDVLGFAGTRCAESVGCGLALHRADPEGVRCEYVRGGRCSSEASYLGGEAFWKKFGVADAGTRQPESFWQALEAKLIAARDS